jgi:hypothetical protein
MTKFSWAWDNQPDRPDTLMTRKRAAQLLRAWRKEPGLKVTCQHVKGIHAYKVHNLCGIGALMVIQRDKE